MSVLLLAVETHDLIPRLHAMEPHWGFSQPNLWKMRDFYLAWPEKQILSTLSRESSKSSSSKDLALLPSDVEVATAAFTAPDPKATLADFLVGYPISPSALAIMH
jgi:hypothetical protein